MQRTLLPLALVVAVLVGTAAHAAPAPQLDLPKKSRTAPPKDADSKGKSADELKGSRGGTGRGNVSSSKVGTRSETKRAYDADGNVVGTSTVTKINAPGSSRSQKTARGKLALPKTRRKPAPPARSEPAPAAPAQPAPTATAPPAGTGGDPGFTVARDSARFLYDQLLTCERPGEAKVAEASDRLGRLGPDGLEVARFALRQNDPVMAYAGARALLIGGTGDDADDVVRMLRGTMPGKIGPMVLEELLERDPVRGSERLLAELLRHDSGPLRRAARRALDGRLDADEAVLLVPALEHRATDVRRNAVELLEGLDGPLPTQLLIDRVTDRSSSVSQIAIRALRSNEDETIDFELLRRVMEGGEILRREALLLIAIVEREDRLVRRVLQPQHAPPLVDALDSPNELARCASAVALAGIGFRAPQSEATAWMDGPVPSTLVGVAAGFTFFDGFELVRDPALRRLRQITGISHGSNGPAWARWWSENKAGFRASRAVIDVTPEDELQVIVEVRDDAVSRPFALVGPALARNDEWYAGRMEDVDDFATLATRGDVVFLTAIDAAELAQLLRDEGVFGPERLPGPRGAFGLDGRSVDVAVGRRAKSFRFASDRTQPWFERVLSRAQGLRERNTWQRYPTPGVHEDSRELYLSEVAWWDEPHEDAEKAERLEGILVSHLRAVPPGERTPALEELGLLAERSDVIAVGDIPLLLDLLVDEARFNDRSKILVQLLRKASADGTDELSRATAYQIIDTLHDRFGGSSISSIVRLLSDQGRDDIVAAVIDERGLLRVAAASALAKGNEDEDVDLLIGLLGDPDVDVQLAAVRSLGVRRGDRARAKVLEMTRSDSPRVRIEALRAIGSLGGPGAIDALVAGLTDPDERFHLPAAEGLAALDDVVAAPLLVSLRRGSARPAVRTAAREGLAILGDRAHDELFSAMRSPDDELRRDASLILSRQLVARAVPVLARSLAENPDDEVLGQELVILTCVDFRDEPLPADRWFQWWDEVDRRDPFSWFLAALERRNLRAPRFDEFAGEGTREARLFLLTIISEVGEPMLAERALRELERMHGSELGPLPMESKRRADWLVRTREIVVPLEDGGSR
ncbi:MAG: HEAT repeat domain-containing protein [Planctomycetota bacterium]